MCRWQTVVGATIALSAFAASVLAGVTIKNVLDLRPPMGEQDAVADSRRLQSLLGVQNIKDAGVGHLLRMRSIRDVVAVYNELGRRAGYTYVAPTGTYVGERLPQGWFWLLDMLTPGTHLPFTSSKWHGKRFVGSTRRTDAWGDNIFKESDGTLTHGKSFLVDHEVRSVLDNRGATATLDYKTHGANGWGITSFMREEVRCIHADLCIGFGNFLFVGGVRNGAPWVLYREGSGKPGDGGPDEPAASPESGEL